MAKTAMACVDANFKPRAIPADIRKGLA